MRHVVISIENAEQYIWGGNCDGWHLLKRNDMSVIQERVPAGSAEVMHYHSQSDVHFLVISVPSTRGEGVNV